MVMKHQKSVHKPQSRKDISNPFHQTKYAENLKRAGVNDITGKIEIINLPNGHIRVKPKLD